MFNQPARKPVAGNAALTSSRSKRRLRPIMMSIRPIPTPAGLGGGPALLMALAMFMGPTAGFPIWRRFTSDACRLIPIHHLRIDAIHIVQMEIITKF